MDFSCQIDLFCCKSIFWNGSHLAGNLIPNKNYFFRVEKKSKFFSKGFQISLWFETVSNHCLKSKGNPKILTEKFRKKNSTRKKYFLFGIKFPAKWEPFQNIDLQQNKPIWHDKSNFYDFPAVRGNPFDTYWDWTRQPQPRKAEVFFKKSIRFSYNIIK